jgi:hypothetical protein
MPSRLTPPAPVGQRAGMRVLFSSIRNTSHFLPLVPFIEACRRGGHEVAVAAPPDLAERVATTGATFMPFGHPGDAGLAPLWKKMREVPPEELPRVAMAEIFAGACASAALPGLLETMQRWRPAIVVRESQEYAALVAAEKLNVPHARVGISARGSELQVIPHAAPAVDQRRRELGLPADPDGDRMRTEPTLTMFPPSFETTGGGEGRGAAADSASTLRFRTIRPPAPPLPDWWGGRREPFVYVTLGTVIGTMADLASAYRIALDAVADLPARVLLTTGAEVAAETLGVIPANVHVERFVPQDQVLPHAAALLCHGGSGTTIGALAAGVPMVVAPMFADQPFNAECIAAAGAGLALPPRTATAAEMRAALTRVLAQPSFRAVAQRFAAEIAALPPVDDAGAELARLAGTATQH